MAKIRYTYRDYLAAGLRSRSSVPDQGDINASVTGQISCINITTSKVGTAIGDSSHVVSTLCTSNGINRYSGFSPYIKAYSNAGHFNSVMTFTKPTSNYKLGDFAGYHHGAMTPGWSTVPSQFNVNVGTDPNTVWITVDVGELDYPTATHLLAIIYKVSDNSIAGYGTIALSGAGDSIPIGITIDGCYTANFYIRTFIADMTDVDNEITNLANRLEPCILCKVPNTSTDATTRVYVRLTTTWYVIATSDQNLPSYVTFASGGGWGMNWSSGVFSVTNLKSASDTLIDWVSFELKLYIDDVLQDTKYLTLYDLYMDNEQPFQSGTADFGITNIPSGYGALVTITATRS